jgi:hypothetical protein
MAWSDVLFVARGGKAGRMDNFRVMGGFHFYLKKPASSPSLVAASENCNFSLLIAQVLV